ncbi:uncharacterized protein METZ01_LOCUS406673, partial [marine metagenome]
SKYISIIGEDPSNTIIDGSLGGINEPTVYLDGDFEGQIVLFDKITVTGGDGGFRVEGSTNGTFKVTNCIIDDNDEHGWGNGATAIGVFSDNSVHLVNTIISGHETGSSPLIHMGSNGGGELLIDRCIVTDNLNSHILSIAGNTGNAAITMTNSVIWENDSELINVDGSFNHVEIEYNNIDTSLASYLVDTDTLVWGPGNLNVDPMFVDTAKGNYHLLASSQLINAGHPDSTDSDDSRADIGTYPYLNSYSGPTWYVETEGNDSTGTGASDSPFGSIQSAV